MKKRTVVSVMSALLAAGLCISACGSSSVSDSSSDETGTEESQTTASDEEPVPVNLVLYGEESERMSDFCQNELHEKVLDAINVDLTVTYLPWSEYAGGKTELMLSSGEKFVTYTDTAFLSKCVAKGYYADLTDAAEKYAGNLIRPVPFVKTFF